jgi:general secretion pathway protein A
MYLEHFHLKQEPFSIAPDPSFLYLSQGHREAMAHLRYGFNHGGFVLITGEVGTGKTTLLRNLIRQTPQELEVAFILNPRLTVRELLETTCDELGIPYDAASTQSIKQFIDLLNKHLLETHRSGRSTVLIIDEAQNLSPAVLEQIRLLTNLETDERKLLRIILIGQPELGALLDRVELRQLAQRITARYHLKPLTREDCYAYLVHRITRAGGNAAILTRPAMAKLYELSGGIPRLLNVLADRSLLGAYVEGEHKVSPAIVRRAAREVLGAPPKKRLWVGFALAALGAAGVASALLLREPELSLPPIADYGAAGVVNRDPAKPTLEAPASPGTARQPAQPPATSEANPADPTRQANPAPTVQLEPLTEVVSRPPGSAYQSQRDAFSALFKAWGLDYPGSGRAMIPCDFAPTADLQCLSRKGSWRDVLALDLPVALELWDDEPNPFYAAVIRANAEQLELVIGNQRLTVSPRALRSLWFGSYIVLWRTPPNYPGNLRRGDRHPTVGWLRRQLEPLLDQQLPSTMPEQFDSRLENAVRQFQLSKGLIVDGIVGPATWIHLGSALGLQTPSLKSANERDS